MIRTKYKRVLEGYLRWIGEDSVFMRPVEISRDPTGPSAAEWMKDWESRGLESLTTSEPELLARYQQGKRCRDWHISEWKQGVREGLFIAEEFIGTLGMDEENFASVFGHAPRESIRELWK